MPGTGARAPDALEMLKEKNIIELDMDRKAAMAAFSTALSGVTLSVQQLRFLEQIIEHLVASGSMDPGALYQPPFTDKAPNGVSDLFRANEVDRIVSTIEGFEPQYEAAM